jgi:hypothetical protein
MRAKTEAPRKKLSGFDGASMPASFATARLSLSLVRETDRESLTATAPDRGPFGTDIQLYAEEGILPATF